MFFFKKPICFLNKSPNFPLFRKILPIRSRSTGNLLLLATLKNTLDIFWKNAAFCQKPKFWRFQEILCIQSQCTASLVPLAVSKKLRIFLRKTNLCFQEGANFSTFWEILLIQLQPKTNFHRWRFSKKSQILFESPIYFIKKNKFWMFSEVLLFQSHFTAKLLLSAILKNFKKTLEKPIWFSFEGKPIFDCFENSYLFHRILVLICFL